MTMIEKKEVLEILKVHSELIVDLNKRGKQKCLCGTTLDLFDIPITAKMLGEGLLIIAEYLSQQERKESKNVKS